VKDGRVCVQPEVLLAPVWIVERGDGGQEGCLVVLWGHICSSGHFDSLRGRRLRVGRDVTGFPQHLVDLGCMKLFDLDHLPREFLQGH